MKMLVDDSKAGRIHGRVPAMMMSVGQEALGRMSYGHVRQH
jgi:hypothetical protein